LGCDAMKNGRFLPEIWGSVLPLSSG
jgi:hypothetical protein